MTTAVTFAGLFGGAAATGQALGWLAMRVSALVWFFLFAYLTRGSRS